MYLYLHVYIKCQHTVPSLIRYFLKGLRRRSCQDDAQTKDAEQRDEGKQKTENDCKDEVNSIQLPPRTVKLVLVGDRGYEHKQNNTINLKKAYATWFGSR